MSAYRSLHALGELPVPNPPGLRVAKYLHPGDLLVAPEPAAATTILASCVAVCLWDPELRIGGMSHFLLPDGARNTANPARYGNLAIPQLLDRLAALGATRTRLRAKIFGGCCRAGTALGGDLGARNVELADGMLGELNIPVIGRDTGGTRARKLLLHTDDFSVWIWRI